MNKIRKQEVMDFFKIDEVDLYWLLKTYTLEQIRNRWVMINWKVQVVK